MGQSQLAQTYRRHQAASGTTWWHVNRHPETIPE